MQVNIKGKPYKVILKKDIFIDSSVAVDGLIDYEKQTISITTKYANEIPSLVYHELIHGYFKECGLDAYAHNEILVDWIARNIEEINKSAASVIEYIKKQETK